MKLIIDIPEDVYKRTVFYREFKDLNDCVKTIKALENGTPLDDVKAEIDDERNLYLNLVGDSGYCNGLNKALKIIDKHIGKTESEDKE